MTIPKAPPWWAVFLFGAAYNALTRCWWAAALCCSVAILLPALDRLDRKLLGRP